MATQILHLVKTDNASHFGGRCQLIKKSFELSILVEGVCASLLKAGHLASIFPRILLLAPPPILSTIFTNPIEIKLNESQVYLAH